ncbi:MAG TPA: hypothetical protein PLV42_01295 [bacterium]|nr:hypothetical protein [bacterium]
MKRYSDLFAGALATLLCFGFITLDGADTYATNRKKILDERIKKELVEIDRRLATAKEQHNAAARKYLVGLAAYKKLQLLKRSAEYHKGRCLWFDDECRRLYDMTVVYLDGEMAVLERRMAPERAEALDAATVHTALAARKELVGNATLPEDADDMPLYMIPELRAAYDCVEVTGWNPARGIFVEASGPFDLPFSTEIVTVHRESTATFIAASFRDVTLYYAYTGEPLFLPGEVAPPYTPLFDRPTGNPVVPGTVLISLFRKGILNDPSFMCRP